MNLPTDISTAVLVQLAAGACGLVATWAVVRYQIRQHAERIADLTRRAEAQEQALQAFKLEAVQRFVSDEMLSKVETRISDAINRLADRLDKVLDGRTSPRSRS